MSISALQKYTWFLELSANSEAPNQSALFQKLIWSYIICMLIKTPFLNEDQQYVLSICPISSMLLKIPCYVISVNSPWNATVNIKSQLHCSLFSPCSAIIMPCLGFNAKLVYFLLCLYPVTTIRYTYSAAQHEPALSCSLILELHCRLICKIELH